MSVLIAVHIPGKGSYVAADRRIICGADIMPDMKKFVCVENKMIIGWVGPTHALSAIKHNIAEVIEGAGQDDIEHRAWVIGQNVVKLLDKSMHKYGDSGAFKYGGEMIIAFPTGIVHMGMDSTPGIVAPNRLSAVGSGADIALGAWSVLPEDMDPVERITRAAALPSRFITSCDAQIDHAHLAC